MDDETRKKLEEQRKDSVSGGGDRISAEGKSAQLDLVDRIADAMDRVDDGEITKTISVWDPTMAAVLDALEDDDARREEIAEVLLEELGRDDDPADQEKADLMKLALRYALEDASEGILDEAREARNRQQQQKPI